MATARRRPRSGGSAGAGGSTGSGGSPAPGGNRNRNGDGRSGAARRTRAPRERGGRRGSELLARVAIGVPLAVLAIGFDNVGGIAWAVAMIGLGVACLIELYRMLERWKPVNLVGYAALAGMCLVARFGGLRDVVGVAMLTVPVLFLAITARHQRGGTTISMAGTLLGVYWLAFAFAHAVLLRQAPHGGGIIIDVMLGTFLGDTGAYLGGRMFGRRPLAPTISPHKTVEGLFCGMLVAVLAVFIAGLYQQAWLTRADALLLGLVVAVLGPIGDLFSSLVKRDAGVKDAGHLFGAHGGAIDRLDAVSFTVVAAYYVWLAMLHH